MKDYRIGFGFDVHRIRKKKKKLILAGITIPSGFSLDAVSDGDVVLHAICDAICGACSLGDIGDYFDPQAKTSKNIDSKKIVGHILQKIRKKYVIENIDITIIAEKPKLKPYKRQMLTSLKKIFAVSAINVKIKSKEGLDILGGKNAIASMAAVLVKTL